MFSSKNISMYIFFYTEQCSESHFQTRFSKCACWIFFFTDLFEAYTTGQGQPEAVLLVDIKHQYFFSMTTMKCCGDSSLWCGIFLTQGLTSPVQTTNYHQHNSDSSTGHRQSYWLVYLFCNQSVKRNSFQLTVVSQGRSGNKPRLMVEASPLGDP